MASEQKVKQYLAYWFQLGKKVLTPNGQTILPQPVIQGDRYSQEFEDCWRHILAASGDSHLEGTEQSIAQLLTPAWELADCARCSMPVPVRSVGIASLFCPCNDLATWPNTEIPAPRSPVNSQAQLTDIRDRLLKDRDQGSGTRG